MEELLALLREEAGGNVKGTKRLLLICCSVTALFG